MVRQPPDLGEVADVVEPDPELLVADGQEVVDQGMGAALWRPVDDQGGPEGVFDLVDERQEFGRRSGERFPEPVNGEIVFAAPLLHPGGDQGGNGGMAAQDILHPPEQGAFDETVGVHDGARFRRGDHHAPIGDPEKIEGVELHPRSEVDDDIVRGQRLQVAHELELHPMGRAGGPGDEAGPADQAQALFRGVNNQGVEGGDLVQDEVGNRRRRASDAKVGLQVRRPEIQVDEDHAVPGARQHGAKGAGEDALAGTPLAAAYRYNLP